MENTNDNFNILWSNLKDQVRKARNKTERAIESSSDSLPGRMYVGQGQDYGRCLIQLNIGLGASVSTSFNVDQLRTIAAHCLAAAEEIEEAKSEAVVDHPSPSAAA